VSIKARIKDLSPSLNVPPAWALMLILFYHHFAVNTTPCRAMQTDKKWWMSAGLLIPLNGCIGSGNYPVMTQQLNRGI